MKDLPLNYRVVVLSESWTPPVPEAPSYQVVTLEETGSQPGPSPEEDSSPYPVGPLVEETGPDFQAQARAAFLEALNKTRRRKVRLRPEIDGLECLGYPLPYFKAMAWLACLLVVLLAGFLSEWSPDSAGTWPFWLGMILLVLAGLCAFNQEVLKKAMKGTFRIVTKSFHPLGLLWQGTYRFLACMLAGPVFLFMAGFLYWLHAGDLEWLDWLVLANLGFVACVYGFFAFLAVVARDDIKEASPGGVLSLMGVLGWKAVRGALGVFIWLVFHGWWALTALAARQENFLCWLSLWICLVSAMYWMAFLLRWMGISFYWIQQKKLSANS